MVEVGALRNVLYQKRVGLVYNKNRAHAANKMASSSITRKCDNKEQKKKQEEEKEVGPTVTPVKR